MNDLLVVTNHDTDVVNCVTTGCYGDVGWSGAEPHREDEVLLKHIGVRKDTIASLEDVNASEAGPLQELGAQILEVRSIGKRTWSDSHQPIPRRQGLHSANQEGRVHVGDTDGTLAAHQGGTLIATDAELLVRRIHQQDVACAHCWWIDDEVLVANGRAQLAPRRCRESHSFSQSGFERLHKPRVDLVGKDRHGRQIRLHEPARDESRRERTDSGAGVDEPPVSCRGERCHRGHQTGRGTRREELAPRRACLRVEGRARHRATLLDSGQELFDGGHPRQFARRIG